MRVFHLGTAFQCETPARFAPGVRGRFILKRAFRRETAKRRASRGDVEHFRAIRAWHGGCSPTSVNRRTAK